MKILKILLFFLILIVFSFCQQREPSTHSTRKMDLNFIVQDYPDCTLIFDVFTRITVFNSAADEHNIYNLNLPSGIYFINLFCQNDRQVIKFIQN